MDACLDPSAPGPAPGADGLGNIRHERFCQLYVGDCAGNATAAYSKSGFNASPQSMAELGHRLLLRPDVKARVASLRGELLDQLQIDRLWISQRRLEIIQGSEKESVKLAALRDLERALDLLPATKQELSAELSLVPYVTYTDK